MIRHHLGFVLAAGVAAAAGLMPSAAQTPQPAAVERPSSQLRRYQPLDFVTIAVPDNWQELRAASGGALYAPPDGFVRRPDSQIEVTHGVDVGVWQGTRGDVLQNLRAFADQVISANRGFREQTNGDGSSVAWQTVGGRRFARMFFTNTNATTSLAEIVSLSASDLPGQRLLYLLTTVPFRDADEFGAAFSAIRDSVTIASPPPSSSIAPIPAVSTSTAAACQSMSVMNLVGLWTGNRGIVDSPEREFRNWADGSFLYWPAIRNPTATIFAFDFKADGSYAFGYGSNGVMSTWHRGCYAVTRASDPAGDRYPYLLALTPAADTLKPSSRQQLGQLPPIFAALERGAQTIRLKESSVGGLLLMDRRTEGRDLLNDIGAVRIYRVNRPRAGTPASRLSSLSAVRCDR